MHLTGADPGAPHGARLRRGLGPARRTRPGGALVEHLNRWGAPRIRDAAARHAPARRRRGAREPDRRALLFGVESEAEARAALRLLRLDPDDERLRQRLLAFRAGAACCATSTAASARCASSRPPMWWRRCAPPRSNTISATRRARRRREPPPWRPCWPPWRSRRRPRPWRPRRPSALTARPSPAATIRSARWGRTRRCAVATSAPRRRRTAARPARSSAPTRLSTTASTGTSRPA